MTIYYLTLSICIVFLVLYIAYNCFRLQSPHFLVTFFSSKRLKYILTRLVFSIISLFFIATLAFILIVIAFNQHFFADNSDILLYSSQYYLHGDDIFKQLLSYYYNILPFPKKVCTVYFLDTNNNVICNNYTYKIIDLGYSSSYMINVSVWSIIKEKCLISFTIGISAYIIQCLVGYPLGIYLAKKTNKFIDKAVDFLNITILSIPAIIYFYAMSIFIILVFKLPIIFDFYSFKTYLSPLICLCFWGCFSVALWVKKYILIEYKKDYVTLSIAKGLNSNKVFTKHVFKNAIIPLIRNIPSSLVACISGFYLLEATFSIPGVGLTLMKAIGLEDVYLILGLTLFISFLSITAYFFGDIITIFLDSRVSFRKEEQ